MSLDLQHVSSLLSGVNVLWLALMGGLFTWACTALGSSAVFFTRRYDQRLMDIMLGTAGGIMLAASHWSLLAPAVEMSQGDYKPAVFGFLVGALTLYAIDRVMPHLHLGLDISQAEGVKTRWQRTVLLVLAITLHNIPEGISVGVAFGALSQFSDPAQYQHALTAALALMIGIGIQDIPEGLAVSMPLRREGLGRFRAFLYGQASGVVEPLGAVLGALAVILMTSLLPYALAFSAGAMVFIVVEEVIPESQQNGHGDLATLGLVFGFALMMALDIGLG
jgi:ZIP family zinc transporter